MASTAFDKLWAAAYEREGELLQHASELLKAHRMSSILDALKLAEALQESGKPFFEFCEAMHKQEIRNRVERLRRQHQLSPQQVKLVKQFIDKSMKGKW
jgi:hypothetical protein